MPRDAVMTAGEHSLNKLLSGAPLLSAGQLGALVSSAAEELDAVDVDLLVVDHEQRHLHRLDGSGTPLDVDGSVAGRAFRFVQVERVPTSTGVRLWVPMIDGLERLGVIGLTVPASSDLIAERASRLASLTAELIISKTLTSDAFHRAARTRPMSLAAEMQWELMPPLTAGTEHVSVAAMLEPAYEVGGDIADYALDPDLAHLAIFDAMGHGTQASLTSALTVGAYRNCRRAGLGLRATAEVVNSSLQEQFKDGRFVTAVFAQLNTDSGQLEWVNAGHPPPLLLRGGRVVKELREQSNIPLGLDDDAAYDVHRIKLEPGDRLLMYTDGVVEAHRPGEKLFGVEGLVDFVARAEASGELLPEMMRRLSRTLLEHHRGRLRDDASQLIAEWRPRGRRGTGNHHP